MKSIFSKMVFGMLLVLGLSASLMAGNCGGSDHSHEKMVYDYQEEVSTDINETEVEIEYEDIDVEEEEEV